MKKVVNIVYQPGAGGEFLTWALSLQEPFVTQKIHYEHDKNKWNVHGDHINFHYESWNKDDGHVPHVKIDPTWITDDTLINLHREHANWILLPHLHEDHLKHTQQIIKNFDDWNSVFIFLIATNEKAGKFCAGLHDVKLTTNKGDLYITPEQLDLHLKHLSNQDFSCLDPFQFWNSNKESERLFRYLERRFSIKLDHIQFNELKKLWWQRNLDILEERV